ncbi:MAG TPA: Hsp20 family protein, partial [Phototrophicaceae bacterium]|nr:Hsp20 family protein [Phototrophicaceae bacterium]
ELKERERVGVLRHRTRRTGEFDYRMTLPGDADPEQVTATLADGVLRVEVAKTEAARPRRIEITRG